MNEIGFRSIHTLAFDAVAEDNPLPVQIISEPTTQPAVFRASFSLAAVSGDAVELVGHDSRIIRVLEVAITKPSAQETVILVKRNSAATGGTSSNATIVPMDSNDSSAATVKLYTAAPTAGVSLGNIARCVVALNDVATWRDELPVLRNNHETLCINVDATATLNGWLVWTEEANV